MKNEKRPKKPFSLAGSKEPVVRDKDNAAPRIKPPELAHVPHPRLAPPGMSGIKMGLPAMERYVGQPSPKPQPPKREPETPKRAFTSLVRSLPEKSKAPTR